MATRDEELKILLEEVQKRKKEIEKTVYYEDFLKAFDTVMSFVKNAEERLATLVKENRDSFSNEAKTAVEDIKTMASLLEEKHSKAIAETKEMSHSEARLLTKMFKEAEERIESLIPDDYDDAELRKEMEDIRASIPVLPDQFDPTELQNEIEELEREIEELKKRPTGTGGGVTNARIIQAMKYIVKTEAPVGDIDGVNTSYTVTQPIFAVLSYSLSGEFIAQIPNYTIAGRTITFTSALPAAYSGKDFEITYI